MISSERGCGYRQSGSVYAEVHLSPNGAEIERFLLDPPRLFNPDALGLTPVGVRLVEIDGVTHVIDWVGSGSYPNVADFIEEARRLGASRKLPRTLDFSRLTPGSRLILAHSRAWFDDATEFGAECAEARCPQGQRNHPRELASELPGGRMCVGLYWHDLEIDGFAMGDEPVERVIPAGSYHGRLRPEGVQRKYRVALFLSLPIHNLAVIRSDSASEQERSVALASAALLPVTLEDS